MDTGTFNKTLAMIIFVGAVILVSFQDATAGTVYLSQNSYESALSDRCGLATVDFEDQAEGTLLTGSEYSLEGFSMTGDLGLQVLSDVVGSTPNGAVGLWVMGDIAFSQQFTVTFSDDRDAIGFYLMDTKDTLEVEGYLLGSLVDTVSFPLTLNNQGDFRGAIFSSEVDEVLIYASDITDGWGVDDITIVDVLCYTDNDGDGMTEEEGDCDDSNNTVYGGADEYCDGVDNDCLGDVDEADSVDASNWFLDNDADGFGDPNVMVVDCYAPPSYVPNGMDCDDGDGNQAPGADEYCNGEDDDCDGSTDEPDALDALIWYADVDGDGFGDALSTAFACTQPGGYLATGTDCDDSEGAIYPGADEYCGEVDYDCDGLINESESLDAFVVYLDADGDGYGDADNSMDTCVEVESYVDNADDCDDSSEDICPVCLDPDDGVDNNCDGVIDNDQRERYQEEEVKPTGGGPTGCGCASMTGYCGNNLIWAMLSLLALVRRGR